MTWSAVSDLPEVRDWAPAWAELQNAADLGDRFAEFMRDFSIEFGPLPDMSMFGDGSLQAEDVRRLSKALTALVADPARPVQVSRDELLARTGWTGRVSFRHDHRFPLPPSYRESQEAVDALRRALSSHRGGYIAVLGPAGSGKSSLLTGFDWGPARVVRYYAFVPDAPNPLSSRGEAESYLNDISLQLELLGLRRKSFPASIAGRQRVLAEQLDRASEEWQESGIPTIVVVDGLDHIAREQTPSRSLIDELVLPAGIPEGVYFVLGVQTTQSLPSAIEWEVESNARSVTVPPLDDDAVEEIIKAYKPTSWLSSSQRRSIAKLSEGHPLALTYLLQDIESISHVDARDAMLKELVSQSKGTVNPLSQRYEGYYSAARDQPEVVAILSAVARLRLPVEIDWLASRFGRASVDIFAQHAASFFWKNGSTWRFVHNSFRLFLAMRTAQHGGQFDAEEDRQRHRALADACGATDEERWITFRREEIAHRLLSGDFGRVLQLAHPDHLQTMVRELRPLRQVREHAGFGLKAAAAEGNLGGYFQLLISVAEVTDAMSALSGDDLALACIGVLDTPRSLEHFVVGMTPQVPVGTLVEGARRFADYGNWDAARSLLRVAGGLRQVIVSAERSPRSNVYDEVAAWSEASARVEGVDATLAEVERTIRVSPMPAAPVSATSSARPKDLQRDLFFAALWPLHRVAMELSETATLKNIVAKISKLGDVEDQITAALQHLEVLLEDRAEPEAVELGRGALKLLRSSTDNDVRDLGTVMAHMMLAAGVRQGEELAPDLIAPSSPAPPDQFEYERGTDQFAGLILHLQVRAFITGEVPDAARIAPYLGRLDDPVRARLSAAIADLVELGVASYKGARDRAGQPTSPHESIIRLAELPTRITRELNTWGRLASNVSALHRRLVGLVLIAGNSSAQGHLLRGFDSAWTAEDRRQHWWPTRRLEVLEEVLLRAETHDEWVADQLRSVFNTLEQEPGGEQTAASWIQASAGARLLGDAELARLALQRAVSSSFQLADHSQEDQLKGWIAWYSRAADYANHSLEVGTATIMALRDRVLWASERHDADVDESATTLIEAAWRFAPRLAALTGEQLCDRGVIKEERLIASIVLAALHSQEDLQIIVDVVRYMLLPVYRGAPHELVLDLSTALANEPLLQSRIEQAVDVWCLPEEAAQWRAQFGKYRPADSADAAVMPPESPASVLRAMVRSVTGETQNWLERIEAIESSPSGIADSILRECERLQVDAITVAAAAGLLASAGDEERAIDAVQRVVSDLSAYSWLIEYEPSERLACWETAARRGSGAVRAAALGDLAACVTDFAVSATLRAVPLRRIAEALLPDLSPVAQWNTVLVHLERMVPSGSKIGLMPTATMLDQSDDPLEPQFSLVEWAAGYVAHPGRVLDDGARQVLSAAVARQATRGHAISSLRTLLSRGEMRAEAALTIVIPDVVEALRPDLERIGVTDDAILRRLAQDLLVSELNPASRPLPTGYSMVFPQLLERRPWAADRRGLPSLDLHDPREVTAPFNRMISAVAEMTGYDEASVLYQAARYAMQPSDPWLAGGHAQMHSLLEARDSRHTFRPWAWMVGRRALGQVIADYVDAGLLESSIVMSMNLIDLRRLPSPLPLDSSTPLCHRGDDPHWYSDKNWLPETVAAAEAYAGAVRPTFILGEWGEWRSLDWGKPSELRLIEPTGHGRGELEGIQLAPRVQSYSPAGAYPNIAEKAARTPAFIVHGFFGEADSSRMEWLAIHPELAYRAGWRPSGEADFSWSGEDGLLRARTVLRARSRTDRQAPSLRNDVGEIWQVELSETGREEILSLVQLVRKVVVTRTVEESKRLGREGDTATASTRILESPAESS